jgi:hypothetical protein
MPITDIGSYVPTMDEFSAHWADVDAELGVGSELKLQGAFGRNHFVDLRDEIVALLTHGTDLENARQIAAADRDAKKATAKDNLQKFRGMVRAVLPKSKYAAALPTAPDDNAAESKFLTPLDDGNSVWMRINLDATIPGFTPPLVVGSLTQASYLASITALRATFVALTTAENDQRIWLGGRDLKFDDARERMTQYRAAVAAVLGENHPLTQSLPDLYPAPGSTPDPVTLSGAWNVGGLHAVLNWTDSTNPNLAEYEIRMSLGAVYNDATATVIANTPPGTTTLQTTNGLFNPGDVATFKVFVRLTTGNVAGSNAVTITRP